MPGRWGMEPARSLESKADFAAIADALDGNPAPSDGVPGAGLNGLVEGVGRELLGRRVLGGGVGSP